MPQDEQMMATTQDDDHQQQHQQNQIQDQEQIDTTINLPIQPLEPQHPESEEDCAVAFVPASTYNPEFPPLHSQQQHELEQVQQQSDVVFSQQQQANM